MSGRAKLTFDVVAAAWPAGVHRIHPGDSGSVTVRFMTTADAPNSGTPARPATWTSIGVPSGTLPGPDAASLARVEQPRRRHRVETVTGRCREVTEDVDEAVRGAGRVEHFDRAVAADAHHHQVGHRTPGTGVQVRRERPCCATGVDREEVLLRHVDRRHVDGDGRTPRRDRADARDRHADRLARRRAAGRARHPSRRACRRCRNGLTGTKQHGGVTTAGGGDVDPSGSIRGRARTARGSRTCPRAPPSTRRRASRRGSTRSTNGSRRGSPSAPSGRGPSAAAGRRTDRPCTFGPSTKCGADDP